ncbi:hypothetical protein ACFXPJ_17390, partial [Streptomyces goshikiensis]
MLWRLPAYSAPGLPRPTISQGAVSSVVYGLWGVFWLEESILPIARWISAYLGWIPFLRVDG